MNIDDDGHSRSGGYIPRAIEECRDLQPVERLEPDQLGLDEPGGIELAELRLCPPGQPCRLNVPAPDVTGCRGSREAQRESAVVWRESHLQQYDSGKIRRRNRAARAQVLHDDSCIAFFVEGIGEQMAIAR